MEPLIGIEPTTYWLQISPSANWDTAAYMVDRVGADPTMPKQRFYRPPSLPILCTCPYMVNHRRIELRTSWLKIKYSTSWVNGWYCVPTWLSVRDQTVKNGWNMWLSISSSRSTCCRYGHPYITFNPGPDRQKPEIIRGIQWFRCRVMLRHGVKNPYETFHPGSDVCTNRGKERQNP